MRIHIGLLLIIFFNSCQMNSQDFQLKGKIATKRINNDICIVYSGTNTVRFKLPDNKYFEYDIICWLNNKDAFISVENQQSSQRATTNSNIVLIDTSGQIIERIHESSPGEYVGIAYPSLSDSLLLLTTRYDNKEQVDNIFYAPISLNIIDFNKKKVIKRIDNLCPRINFEMVESPWSPDEKYFVYSVFDKRKMTIEGENEKIRFKPPNGIYIYSIEKEEYKQITDEGHYAIWSPKGDQIAYLIEDEIWLYNVNDSTNTMFYQSELYERIKDIHWTPDGEYLFMTCPKYYLNKDMLFSYNEKLISIAEKKPVDFQKMNKGLNWYTWKK